MEVPPAGPPLAITVSVEDRFFGLWQVELFAERFRLLAPPPGTELVVMASTDAAACEEGIMSPYLAALAKAYPWAHFVLVPTRTGLVVEGHNFRVINKSASRHYLLERHPRWREYDMCVIDPDILPLPPFLDGYQGPPAGTVRSEHWRWIEPGPLREAVVCLAAEGCMAVEDPDEVVREIVERYPLGYMFTLAAADAGPFCRRWEAWTERIVRGTTIGWMSDPYATVLAAYDLGLTVERVGYTMSSAWTGTTLKSSASILHYAWPNDFFYKKNHLEPGSGPFRAADYPEEAYPEGSIGRYMCACFNQHVRTRPASLAAYT